MMSLEDFRSELFAGATEESSFFNISSHPLIFISCHYTILQLQQSNTYYSLSLNVFRMGFCQCYVLFGSQPIPRMLSSTRRVVFRLSTGTFQHNSCCSWRFINEFSNAMPNRCNTKCTIRDTSKNLWMQSLTSLRASAAGKMRRQGCFSFSSFPSSLSFCRVIDPFHLP